MNWDTPAQLHVYGSDGNEIAPGEIVAVVIAPGGVMPSNASRSGTAAPTCGGNYTAAAYLDHDTIHNINNADAATGKFILPHQHRDADGNVTLSVNDQFVYITRQGLWTAIQGRGAREAKRCLDDYAAANGGRYPWAVPLSTPTSFAPLMLGAYNTRFGRLPTRPNVQTEAVTNDIVTMQDRFAELWTTLEAFAAEKSFAKLLAMKASALAAKNAADAVGDNYDGTPLENPADLLLDAADDAQDKLFTSSSSAYIASIQQQIVDAANAFAAAMSSEFTQAAGMSDSWPASCTLFASAQWTQWKDLLFYQVAAGFQPAGTASCGAGCLSVAGSAHTAAGSGSYRAVVIGAGKQLGASRDSATPGDYLEADNLLPRNDPSLAYQTLRVTDGGYPSLNDLVLCLDGRMNCP